MVLEIENTQHRINVAYIFCNHLISNPYFNDMPLPISLSSLKIEAYKVLAFLKLMFSDTSAVTMFINLVILC